MKKRLEELEKEEQNPNIFSNVQLMKSIGKEKKEKEKLLNKIELSQKQIEDLFVLFEMISSELNSQEEWRDFEVEFKKAKEHIENLYIETLYSGDNDDCSALLVLHAGAGGEEAQDWTDMLHRMYSRFAEKEEYSDKILDYLYGDGAGYKSVTMLIEGEHAYGNFKCERGVHRLVRISPFDANKRRHTSFASVEIEIKQEDLKIDTYRSGGAGGQHINKTESAVRITHIPTGIIVACQNERSQTQNKETAMKMLYAKLAEKAEKEKEEEHLKQLGLQRKIEWGSQIRSYVLCPYNLVKDHRTDYETSDVQSVLDGDITAFINEYLRKAHVKSE